MIPQNATWKMVPVASLHEDPTNARAHGEANRRAVRSSLSEFGQVETLVVTPEGRVLGGNCRLGELRALGVKEVMVAEVALGGHDATRLGLVLNRTAELATWDEDNLEALLRDLDAEDAAEGLGWDERDLEALLRPTPAEAVAWKTFDENVGGPAPAPPAETPVAPWEPPAKKMVTCPHCGETFDA